MLEFYNRILCIGLAGAVLAFSTPAPTANLANTPATAASLLSCTALGLRETSFSENKNVTAALDRSLHEQITHARPRTRWPFYRWASSLIFFALPFAISLPAAPRAAPPADQSGDVQSLEIPSRTSDFGLGLKVYEALCESKMPVHDEALRQKRLGEAFDLLIQIKGSETKRPLLLINLHQAIANDLSDPAGGTDLMALFAEAMRREDGVTLSAYRRVPDIIDYLAAMEILATHSVLKTMFRKPDDAILANLKDRVDSDLLKRMEQAPVFPSFLGALLEYANQTATKFAPGTSAKPGDEVIIVARLLIKGAIDETKKGATGRPSWASQVDDTMKNIKKSLKSQRGRDYGKNDDGIEERLRLGTMSIPTDKHYRRTRGRHTSESHGVGASA